MPFLIFLLGLVLVGAPLALVFTVLFATFKMVFKLGFWILQLAAAIFIWTVIGGGLLAFLGLMLGFNLLCVPLFFVICSR